MNTKKILLILLACISIIAFEAISASADTYKDLTYKISDGKAIITKCSSRATEVVIPDNLNGYPFADCTLLKSVTIPESVTIIGDEAFVGCTALTSAEISNNVETIGYRAFRGAGITNIVIPDSVKSIGVLAFASCSKLTSVVIGNGVDTLAEGTFQFCTKLADITQA